jgi:hypothetical protein
MLLIGYFYDIKSERRLEKEIRVNLACRWFIGYDIDEKIPEHSVISQTRRRKFTDSGIFQEIFDEIVRKLIDRGLVEGNTILSDSTHIKANASLKSFLPTKEYLHRQVRTDNGCICNARECGRPCHIYIYAGDRKICQVCPVRKKCINSNNTVKPKLLYISIYQRAVDYQLRKENTEEWNKS